MTEQGSLDIDQPPDLTEQLAELERELAIRRRVYPRWVADGQLRKDVAEYRIRVLEAAIETVKRQAGHG